MSATLSRGGEDLQRTVHTEHHPLSKVERLAKLPLAGETLAERPAQGSQHCVDVWFEGCHSGRRKVLGDGLLDPDVLLGSNLGEDVEEELAVDDGAADRMPFRLNTPSVSDKCYKPALSH